MNSFLDSFKPRWWGEGFEWERDSVGFYSENHTVIAIIAALYLPTVYVLKNHVMAKREAFELKVPLIIWNALLAMFSMAGFLSLIGPSLHQLVVKHNGNLVASLCDTSLFRDPVSRWIFLFDVSKMVEFVDTIFLVLRKKPVIFLHWYHHIMTMTYCWIANQTTWQYNSFGFVGANANFAIHSVMYSYYGLAALGKRPWWGRHLTTFQILQMVLGFAMPVVAHYGCGKSDEPLYRVTYYFTVGMYATYFALFFKLYIDKWVKGGKAASGRKDQATSTTMGKSKRA